jgi:hypothetical protein
MKHILLILVLLFSVVGVVSAQDDAAETPAAGTYAVISSQNINVRATPSLTGNIINGLGTGLHVQVTQAVVGDAYVGSTTWYEVVVDGVTGYVHGSLLTPVGAPVAEPVAEEAATDEAATDAAAEPVAEPAVAPADAPAGSGTFTGGLWQYTLGAETVHSCLNYDTIRFPTVELYEGDASALQYETFMVVAPNASSFTLDDQLFVHQGNGVYTSSYSEIDYNIQYTLNAVSPTLFTGQEVDNVINVQGLQCSATIPVTMTKVG